MVEPNPRRTEGFRQLSPEPVIGWRRLETAGGGGRLSRGLSRGHASVEGGSSGRRCLARDRSRRPSKCEGRHSDECKGEESPHYVHPFTVRLDISRPFGGIFGRWAGLHRLRVMTARSASVSRSSRRLRREGRFSPGTRDGRPSREAAAQHRRLRRAGRSFAAARALPPQRRPVTSSPPRATSATSRASFSTPRRAAASSATRA